MSAVLDATTCDTVVVSGQSEDGVIGMVAPGPQGVLAWSGGVRSTSIHLDRDGRDTVLGRSGSGPDEFHSIGLTSWVGDTLWVSDYRQGRSVGYTIDGGYVTTLTPPLPAAWVRLATGEAVGLELAGVAIPKVLFLSSDSGEQIDTVAEFAAPDTFHAGDLGGASPFTLRRALAAWNPEGGRLCGVTPGKASDIHIQCVTPAGEPELDTTVVLTERVVTQHDYDDVMAALVKGLEPGLAARLREATPKPPFFTAAFNALMDNRDRFWIQRSAVGEQREIWAVLSPRGVPLRSMTLGPGLNLVAVRDDLVYLRAERADGFQDLLRCCGHDAFPLDEVPTGDATPASPRPRCDQAAE